MKFDIVGIGNPLIDLSVRVEEHNLAKLGLAKGMMQLIDEERAKQVHSLIRDFEVITTPAGSCANTMMACANLGLSTAFIGRIGLDAYGSDYIQKLTDSGVMPLLAQGYGLTGTSVCFVTPDSQRTMATHLGASSNFTEKDLHDSAIRNGAILHIEGYQILVPGQKSAVIKAIREAKKASNKVSFDLADPMLVKNNKAELLSILKDVDVVFANEAEAEALTGLPAHDAVKEIARLVPISVVKTGVKGSLIAASGKIVTIRPFKAKAIDTTGAGDVYASGFLYGLCKGFEFAKAGKLASFMAARITEQYGARFDYPIAKKAKKYL